jgi:hypothetical protein
MPEMSQENLPQGDLDRLVKHLQEEEVQAQKAKLSSVESLKVWISKHPSLQQAGLMETITIYGPAILELLRRALGL